MDSRRLAYLQAMGIDVWQFREEVTQTAEAELPLEPAADASLSTVHSAVPLPAANAELLDDWPALEARISGCQACGLHTTRTQTVFGVGNRAADWMIIGEAPGAEEDRQGEPFVGRAGQLLNAMLKSIGLARQQVFIANILKCRPPGNRDPKPEEAACCTRFLFRQIELVNPKLLLCVGRIAAQTLLETDRPIGQLRGKVHRLASGRPMVVTYHPAYLLRSPLEKRKAWADLLLAVRTVEQLDAGGGVRQVV